MTLKEYVVVAHKDNPSPRIWHKDRWAELLEQCRKEELQNPWRIITTFNADEQLQEQKGLRWVKGSDRQPPNGVDVPIKEYSGVFEIASYSEKDDMFHTYSDLGPLSKHQVYWLEETEPGQPVPAGEEYRGSITSNPTQGIQLGCISPEARNLLDEIMEAWEPHYQDLKENNKDYEPGFYGFAYWLVRWSGLVQPAPPSPKQDKP